LDSLEVFLIQPNIPSNLPVSDRTDFSGRWLSILLFSAGWLPQKDVEDGLQSFLTTPKGHQGRQAHATSANTVFQGPLNGTWCAERWSNQILWVLTIRAKFHLNSNKSLKMWVLVL